MGAEGCEVKMKNESEKYFTLFFRCGGDLVMGTCIELFLVLGKGAFISEQKLGLKLSQGIEILCLTNGAFYEVQVQYFMLASSFKQYLNHRYTQECNEDFTKYFEAFVKLS